MPKECVSDQEQVFILSWKSAFMNYKVAFIIISFVKVLIRLQLEYIVAHLESNWLHFLCNRVTTFHDMAECSISGTV